MATIGSGIQEGLGQISSIVTSLLVFSLVTSMFVDVITRGIYISLPDDTSVRLGEWFWGYVLDPDNLGTVTMNVVGLIFLAKFFSLTLFDENGGGTSEDSEPQTHEGQSEVNFNDLAAQLALPSR